MSRTELKLSSLFGLLVLAAAAGSAGAQTIGQMADAQRAKLAEEIRAASAPKDVASAPVAAAKPAPATAPAKVAPAITVHAIYARSGQFIAELTDGRSLSLAMPGMRVGNAQIEKVDAAGVHTIAAAGCKAKCPGKRVVTVGGSL